VGLACTLYNSFTLSFADRPQIALDVTGEGAGLLKPQEGNFAVRAIRRLQAEVGAAPDGLAIKMQNAIPLSRGLGSSAAAIVAALASANYLLGEPLDKESLFTLATELEGHPDNVAPALYGGVTVSFLSDKKPFCFRIRPPAGLRLVAAVPDFPLPTKTARKALPARVAHRDAVFNLSRAALLAASMCGEDFSLLGYALEDKLHQPYRSKFIPGMADVFARARQAGAFGCFISGSGPTLMAFVPDTADAALIGEQMCAGFAAAGRRAVSHVLSLTGEGVRLVKP
jgi:homoserine kinase